MTHQFSDAGMTGKSQIGESSKEEHLLWTNGSTLMRTQSASGSCQRNFVRNDIALGICFQKPGSEVHWRVDGKRALDKSWTTLNGSRDLLIVPAGCELSCSCRGSGEGLWLFLDAQAFDHDNRMRSFLEKVTVNCSWTKDRLACLIACEIKKESGNGYPRGPMFFENAAMIFVTQLAYLLDKGKSQSETIRALCDLKLNAIIEYIEVNLHRNVTLSELARLANLSPRYFCGAFKEAMGRPPHQFQIERRVERAKSLLNHSNLKVTDVALTVGFSSQSHLNEYFRRIVGITPARYRLEAQKEKNKKLHRTT